MMKLIRPFALAFALLAAPVTSTVALAQAEQPAAEGEGEGEGNGPVPGYIATGMLAALAMFFLCKSARR